MKFILVFLVSMLSFRPGASTASAPPREERELQMALKVIKSSFIADAIGSVPDVTGFKSSAVELALALIASRDDSSSNKAFVSLLAYKLDGGLSEDFHCYALKKGKRIIPEMKGLDVSGAINSCRQNIKGAALYEAVNDSPALQDRICRGTTELAGSIATLVVEIEQSKRCDPDDF